MLPTYHHGNLRASLLARAIEILCSAGIESLSLRAQARELGVSHAAPLRHFKSKADLFATIAIEGVQSLMQDVEKARDLPEGTVRLLGVGTAYVDWAIHNPAYYQVMRSPDVMRHAEEMLGDLLCDFGQAQHAEIQRAQRAGWRSGDETEVLFLHLSAPTVGTAMLATDPIYPKPIGIAPPRDFLLAPIQEFLNLSAPTRSGA